jgi:hypothetical protein
MKKETKPNNVSIYDAEVNKKSLDEVITDIIKNYQSGKKIKVTVSV